MRRSNRLTQDDRERMGSFLLTYLGHRRQIPALAWWLRHQPDELEGLADEVDEAVRMVRRYQLGESIEPFERRDLQHCAYLCEHLGERRLPLVIEVRGWVRSGTVIADEALARLLNMYDFLDTMQPPGKLAAALAVLGYRSVVLKRWPDLRQQGVMVGSSLEEMVSVMAVQGKRTRIFRAIRDWVNESEEEGFTPALAALIQNIEKEEYD